MCDSLFIIIFTIAKNGQTDFQFYSLSSVIIVIIECTQGGETIRPIFIEEMNKFFGVLCV